MSHITFGMSLACLALKITCFKWPYMGWSSILSMNNEDRSSGGHSQLIRNCSCTFSGKTYLSQNAPFSKCTLGKFYKSHETLTFTICSSFVWDLEKNVICFLGLLKFSRVYFAKGAFWERGILSKIRFFARVHFAIKRSYHFVCFYE